MEIATILSLILGAISLFFAYRTYAYSSRGMNFSLSPRSRGRLNINYGRKLFHGLEDIDFSLTNLGMKPIIIESIIIEKNVIPEQVENRINDLYLSLYGQLHFYVSEESFDKPLTPIIGEESKTATSYQRKYNLLDKEITIQASEKHIFTFTKEKQFRELYYTFDNQVCLLAFNHIYALDTHGKKYQLSKKDGKKLVLSSWLNSYIVLFNLNSGELTENLLILYIYLLAKNRKKPVKGQNYLSDIICNHMHWEGAGQKYDIDKITSEKIKKGALNNDNKLIYESLKSPMNDELNKSLDTYMKSFGGDVGIDLDLLRQMTIQEMKSSSSKLTQSYLKKF